MTTTAQLKREIEILNRALNPPSVTHNSTPLNREDFIETEWQTLIKASEIVLDHEMHPRQYRPLNIHGDNPPDLPLTEYSDTEKTILDAAASIIFKVRREKKSCLH